MVNDQVTLPGYWIDHPDRNWAEMAYLLLTEVLGQLDEASIVLTKFNECKTKPQVPNSDGTLRVVYAKAFIYALDATAQIVKVFGEQEQLSAEARELCIQFNAEFGYLHSLRNSLQHIEDRIRGIGKYNKIIESFVIAIGGSFRNHIYFGATSSEGQYIEIKISETILNKAYLIVDDLLWCFDWLGPGEVHLTRPNSGP